MSPPEQGNGTGAPEVMIDVENLTRYYGAVPALNDVSFQAHRGEIVGFLGPNGAGKTTAMRILTGFMPPSSGSARVAGYDVIEQSLQARRATGYLPENTPLYRDMSVYGYLDFMAKLRGVPDRAEAIERVMKRVSIDHRADDLIGQLSKGLRQRVGIAQAMVHNPEVIILDEPTIGLDPQQIREVRGLIRELGGDHTIILSTHILSEAEQICDRVLIIDRGEIVVADALERLTQRSRAGGEQFRVGVVAGADDARIAAWLETVEGVTEVQALGSGTFLVTADRERDARLAVADGVMAQGWRMLELSVVEVTLEDIFLQVTAHSASSDGPQEDASGETDVDAEQDTADELETHDESASEEGDDA